MFDHDGVKTIKVNSNLLILILQVKFKIEVTKNLRLKNITYITTINFEFSDSQNLFYKVFLNEFLMSYFLQDSMHLRLISKSPQHLKIKIWNKHPSTISQIEKS